jgi:hypothetical protein
MSGAHMLRYHLLIPAAIVAVLVVVGVPFATAFFVGMMAGCMSMMLMMMGGGHHGHHGHEDSTRGPEDRHDVTR